ncbi:hypothetical protein BH10ACT7_BH10ACT7_28200 [soil metagenome]
MVIIESGGRRVVVDDGHGALILSIEDVDGTELLAGGNPPIPALRPLRDLAATGYRGWIDCFPSIEPEADSTNGRGELQLAGHGELWWRSWKVDHSSEHEVGLSCRLEELGVVYTRRVSLGTEALVVSSTISNRADVPVNYVWASHPLLAADDSTWMELADSEVTRWPQVDDEGERLDAVWPADSARRHWTDLPTGTAVKVFMPWPAEGVTFSTGGRDRHLAFRIEGEHRAPYLGLWINRGGFPSDSPLYHFAIEPTVGSTDSLRTSVEHGTAGVLAGGASVSLEVVLTF